MLYKYALKGKIHDWIKNIYCTLWWWRILAVLSTFRRKWPFPPSARNVWKCYKNITFFGYPRTGLRKNILKLW